MKSFIVLILLLVPSMAFGQADRIQVKNNAGSLTFITDIGRGISGNSTEDISPTNYLLWAESNDIDTLIDANTLDILLNTNTLSNDDAKELIHSLRIMKVSQSGTIKTRDVIQFDFVGSTTVTDKTNGKVEINVGGEDEDDVSNGWLTYMFFGSGGTKDKWLEVSANQNPSNETTLVVPFDVKLHAISWGNKENNADSKIRVTKNSTSSGTYVFQWTVSNKKHAYKSNIGPSNIYFDAGDRVRVYAKEYGDKEPDSLNIHLYFKVINNNTGEGGQGSGS